MSKLRMLTPTLKSVDTRIVRPPPKQAEDHYQSPEHKRWRLEVMRRALWRCQHSGCDVHFPARLFADHIVEIRDGGAPLDPANGQALCGAHHTTKTVQHRAKRMQG